MHPTQELYEVIQSLTPSEKRYFKIYASRHTIGNKNNYEKLFDALDRWEINGHFDEKAFAASLRGKTFGKNLASDKNHLHGLLLDAMRQYYNSNRVDQTIYNLLADETFYKLKRHNRLRLRAIEKAKELASKYELFPQWLIILQREAVARNEIQQEKLLENAASVEEQTNSVFELLELSTELRTLNSRLFSAGRQNLSTGDHAALARSIGAHGAIKNYLTGRSFVCDRHYLQIQSLIARVCGHQDECTIYQKRIYRLYQAYPHFIDYDWTAYKISLFNLMNSLLNTAQYDEFKKHMDEVKKIDTQHLDEEGEDWQNIIHLELMYAVNSGDYAHGATLYDELEKGLKVYSAKVNSARRIVLLRNMMICLFIQGNYDLATRINHQIMNDKTQARQDIKMQCPALDILLHFEQNNFDLLDYQLRNLQRSITRQRKLSAPEEFFLRTFKEAIRHPANKIPKTWISKTVSQWEETTQAHNGFVPDEFSYWLEHLLPKKAGRS